MKLKTLTKEEFDSKTDNEKRLIVAKDVVDMLKADVLIAKSDNAYIELDGTASVAKELSKVETCVVCAIGAAYVASVLRFNYEIGSTKTPQTGGEDMVEQMPFFEAEQLESMETAFEYSDAWWGAYEDETERLLAIWQSVLDNDSEFDIEKFPATEASP